jgi:hypothetical protein
VNLAIENTHVNEPEDYSPQDGQASHHELLIPPECAGLRLDQALARLFPSHSRSRLQAWLKSGRVMLDGGQRDAKHKVWGGESLIVDSAPQPLFFTVPADQLDREDLMTAWLRRGVNFGLSGALTYTERDGLEIQPLARTSGNTMRMPAAEALMRPSPFDILNMWPQAGGRIETIALRVSGNLQTAFPEGAPAPEAPAPEEGARPAPAAAEEGEQLTRSATPAELVIVADADFLADDFYVDPQSGGAAADNASFALNAIDVLGGSNALVSLRSRAPSLRRMDMVEDMEADAARRIQRRQEELQGELQETEARLAELQARGRGSGFFTGDLGAELTPEENAEIERFRQRVVEVRGELRRTERELRGDIERLEALVVFINIWLAPILIAAGGLFLFWRRQRRTGARR